MKYVRGSEIHFIFVIIFFNPNNSESVVIFRCSTMGTLMCKGLIKERSSLNHSELARDLAISITFIATS